MALLKGCFLRKRRHRPTEHHSNRNDPSLNIPRNGSISESVELSLDGYSLEIDEDNRYVNVSRASRPISLSEVTSVNGTRRHDNRYKTYPTNSTFINAPMSCVHTLDFSIENRTKISTIIAGADTCSSGYSSKSDVESSDSRWPTPTVVSSMKGTEANLCDCQMLGVRPECIGQESSPDKSQNDSEITKCKKSEDSDDSGFMRAQLCRPRLVRTSSKASHKSISRNLKQFRKQFHHLGQATDCSLDTLAIL
jgi:hypothetical protein